jgi:hypothetical protein
MSLLLHKVGCAGILITNVLLDWVFILHSLHVHSGRLTQNRLRRLNIRVPFVNIRFYIHLQLYMLRLFQRTYNTYHPTLNI